MIVDIHDKKLNNIVKNYYKYSLLSKLYEEDNTYVNGVHNTLLIEETTWYKKNEDRFKNFKNSFNLMHIDVFIKRFGDNLYLITLGLLAFIILNISMFLKGYFIQKEYINKRSQQYKDILKDFKISSFKYNFGFIIPQIRFLLFFIFSYNIERFIISLSYCMLRFFQSFILILFQVILLAPAIIISGINSIADSIKNRKRYSIDKNDRYIQISE